MTCCQGYPEFPRRELLSLRPLSPTQLSKGHLFFMFQNELKSSGKASEAKLVDKIYRGEQKLTLTADESRVETL